MQVIGGERRERRGEKRKKSRKCEGIGAREKKKRRGEEKRRGERRK